MALHQSIPFIKAFIIRMHTIAKGTHEVLANILIVAITMNDTVSNSPSIPPKYIHTYTQYTKSNCTGDITKILLYNCIVHVLGLGESMKISICKVLIWQ